MQAQTTSTPSSGLSVAYGYGLRISVHRGHLIVHDGIGRQRQTRRYHRVTSKLRRLVVIGHTGYITLDALRWLHDIGAALIHIDADGQLLTTSTARGPGHAGLRRAQALAPTTNAGLEVTRSLLHQKVSGQASLLPELPARPEASALMKRCLENMTTAPGIPMLLAAEADAASVYWDAWSAVPIPIATATKYQPPDHWSHFGTRHSPLSSSPRLACNPANAILNYLYALLEAETTIACHTVGLDPLLGIFHTDQRSRASLALDAMEAIRPLADAYLLALLTQWTLSHEDFVETRQGSCRLTPGMAARLATTTTTWRDHIGPVIEGTAHHLLRDGSRPVQLAAHLTRAQHHAAWEDRKPVRTRRSKASATPTLPNACRDCGTYLPDRRKRYCDHCRGERWTKHAQQGRDSAASVLARLRTEQRDPAHGGEAAQARGRKNAVHQEAVKAWTGPPADPHRFREQILPGLYGLPVQALVGATGLSDHYCSLIRLGKRVPHARHWEALRRLGS
jgi:CRISPR-associated endonuclease Cas1